MSTWVRTDQAGGVFVYEIPDDAIESIEVVDERPEVGASCDCCCWVTGPDETRLPCTDSCCVIQDCARCVDPTCPCCHSEVECLDEEDNAS